VKKNQINQPAPASLPLCPLCPLWLNHSDTTGIDITNNIGKKTNLINPPPPHGMYEKINHKIPGRGGFYE
ncbi:MAG: hypothetical protein ACBR13_08590, partial [Microcoleus sp.]